MIGVFFWGLAHIAGPVLMFALGAIIAYALTPLVGRLTRVMPRWLALIIVYIGLLVVIAAAIFLLVVAVFQEFGPLVDQINKWLQSQGGNGAAAITDYLKQLGLTQDQINSLTNDLASFLKGLAADVVPVTAGLLTVIFNAVIVGMVSIYLVLDGSRFLKWATGNTPVTHRRNVSFFVQSLDRVMGGYIRGQLLLCLAISVMIAVFMGIIGVPFWPVLAVLAFIFEFIPMIGLWLVGAVCVLVALSQGWADRAAGADSRHRRQRHRGQHPLAAPAGTCGGRPSARLALLPAGLRRALRPVGRALRRADRRLHPGHRDGLLAAVAQQPSRTVSRRCGGAAAGAGHPRLQQWRG